jgi:hypothetical protein
MLNLVKVQSCKKFIYHAKDDSSSIRHYVCNKDFFSLIHETQWEIGDGRCNQMFGEPQRTRIVTAECIMI